MTFVLAIVCVALLLALELLWRASRRSSVIPRAVGSHLPLREPSPPADLFLDAGHSWVRLLGDGTLRVGIDDLLAGLVGRVDGVDLPRPGTQLERGEPCLSLRRGDRRLRLLAPASGEVVAQNGLAQENPQVLADDPYGLGWAFALRPRDHKQAIAPLHLGNGATGFVRAELGRVVEFLAERSGSATAPLFADGGLPLRGALAELDPAGWAAFEERFLR